MTTKLKTPMTLAAAFIALACIAQPVMAERQPRNASSTVQRTGPNGKTASRATQVTSTDNSVSRTTVKTGPNGKSTTVQGDVVVDPATGVATQSRTRTGPDGQVISSTSRTVQTGASAE